jgi:hypothetical protein
MSRRLAVSLSVLGLLLVAYAAVVILWRDPATDLYARWQQHRLDDALAQEFVEFPPRRSSRAPARLSPIRSSASARLLFPKSRRILRLSSPRTQAVSRGGFGSGSRWGASPSPRSTWTRSSSTGRAGPRTSRAGPPLPTEFTVDVTCVTPTGRTIEETFTFGEGGGVGTTLGGTRARIGIPVGSTCTVVERDTDTFPDGSVVRYIPGQTVTIGEGIGVVVLVVNNFRDVETLTGSLRINKVVEPPSADLPDRFRVHAACTDRTITTVTVPAGGSATVEGIRAGAYCAVRERTRSLPSDLEITYSGDGVVQVRRHGIVQIVENETVEMTINNDAGISPGPPEPRGRGGAGVGKGGPARPRGELPLTGGPAVLLGGIGLLLFAGGLALAGRTKS